MASGTQLFSLEQQEWIVDLISSTRDDRRTASEEDSPRSKSLIAYACQNSAATELERIGYLVFSAFQNVAGLVYIGTHED